MKDSRITQLERLVREGRFDEAADLAGEIIHEHDFDAPEEVYELLDRSAERSEHGRLLQAMLIGMGVRTPDSPETYENILRSLTASENQSTRLLATFPLGSYLCSKGEMAEGLALLKTSATGGVPGAWHAYASTILEDDEADDDAVLEELLAAHRAGEVTATSALGRILFDYELEIPGIDPIVLLQEASAKGDTHASEAIAEIFGSAEDEDESEDLVGPADILPYIVVPSGMKRPRLVKEALIRETGMPEELAERMTARFHGFPEWRMMKNAAEDARRPKGPFDEDCSAEAYNERVAIQAEVAQAFGFGEEHVSEAIVQLLAPTAKDGKPSLRRLQSKLEGRMFNVGARQIRKGMEKVMSSIGYEGDPEQFMEAMRTRLPLKAAPMIEKLQEFGWSLTRVDTAEEKDGALIANGIAPDGREFDIYGSVVSYTIGDRGDVHVESLMRSIEQKGRPSALLFTRARVYPVDGSRGLLYGGRAYDGSDWWDFVIRPGSGIENVFNQKGRLSAPMDPVFRDEYAYEGAMNDCVDLDAGARGLQRSDLTDIRLVGTDDGWKSPISGEASRAFGLMKQMRSSGPGF